jgi:hypothetical protein
LVDHLRGCHILNDVGGKIMSRFEITQKIIEDGIDKKMKTLTKLKPLLHQNPFLSERPETIFFNALEREKTKTINVTRLKKDLRYPYLNDMKKAIYIISAPHFPCSWEKITNLKKQKTITAFPKINDKLQHWDRQEGKKTKCLYVGSSHDIAGRVIQHFWKCPKDTYALRLIEWNWWKGKSDVQIDIWDASEISDIHLQIIEDIVWEKYQPLFGREGTR